MIRSFSGPALLTLSWNSLYQGHVITRGLSDPTQCSRQISESLDIFRVFLPLSNPSLCLSVRPVAFFQRIGQGRRDRMFLHRTSHYKVLYLPATHIVISCIYLEAIDSHGVSSLTGEIHWQGFRLNLGHNFLSLELIPYL